MLPSLTGVVAEPGAAVDQVVPLPLAPPSSASSPESSELLSAEDAAGISPPAANKEICTLGTATGCGER